MSGLYNPMLSEVLFDYGSGTLVDNELPRL